MSRNSVIVLCSLLVFCVDSRSLKNNRGVPRGCSWIVERNNESQQPVLVCQIRTIVESDILRNLTQSEIANIVNLKLVCSDVLYFESSLKKNAYGSFLSNLNQIADLRIEHCKIRNVPANSLYPMHKLKKLTLRSHNSDWISMTLELDSESFRGLGELRYLDLSDNNIWNIPKDLFCPLLSITHLNLTNNKIQDVQSLRFSDWGDGPQSPGTSCSSELEVLDISSNAISEITDNALSGLRKLKALYLQNNVIESLGDRAFAGLNDLTILNISNNLLVALPPELFQYSRQLHHLYLQNNSLNVLAPDLLAGLDQLQVLDMGHNDLSSEFINRDTFPGLVRLVILNLSYNRLNRIDLNLFHDLYTLQILNLEHNNIEFIAENAFSELKNLHSLTLSYNRISAVDTFHFSGMYALNQLLLDFNRIKVINERAFENLTNLQDLGLNNNLLGEVPTCIGQLRFLKTLDLGKNLIESVNNSSFEGLDMLYGLRLVDNFIKNISRDSFSTLPSLQVLNLASNKIKYVEQSAFSSNPTLKAIRLDSNELADISGVFTNLQSLVWLNVSSNSLTFFDYSHFPFSLDWLDIHDNQINKLSNYYEIIDKIRIKTLDVSFNALEEIDGNSIPNSVEVLFLNNNQIKTVQPETFSKKYNLEKVVLYGNNLSYLDLSALRLPEMPESRELPEFYIGGNPFQCDCKMEWLLRINQMNNVRHYPQISDLDGITCELVHSRGDLTPKPVLELKSSQFLCPYESHCFTVCHCCEFDACDCKMTCPDKCKCYHDETWNSNIVDCSNAGLTEVPQNIPMDATEIYLDGNDMGELGSHVFIGKKKLKVLFLNDSNVRGVHNRTFNGVESLRVLHMENNELEELNGYEFDQLINLNELYLDHNKIQSVEKRTFENLPKLKVLKLDENEIVNFAPWGFERVEISLEGNRWSCDCDSLQDLAPFLKRDNGTRLLCAGSAESVRDALRRCDGDGEFSTPIQRGLIKDTDRIFGGHVVPLLATLFVAILILSALSAVAFFFRQDVRLWIYSKYGVRIFQPVVSKQDGDNRDKLYDCYVIYSLGDEELASRLVAAELEHLGHGLCLHYRDLHLIGGASYLADAMVSAADASKRVVLLVSSSLLRNEWSKPEFRAALQASLHATRHNLICILSINCMEPLDPEMKDLLQASTIVRWGERRFWEKLRYVMPDVTNNKSARSGIKYNINIPTKNSRYITAPTPLDNWYKYAAVPAPNLTPTPTQSTYVSVESQRSTEDEGGSSTSSQHYNTNQLNHSYLTIDAKHAGQFGENRVENQHVYSTIPENLPTRTYFV